MVDCQTWREAISARIDGEDGGLALAGLERHLAECPACLAWQAEAIRVTRSARLRPAELVPDLAARVMSAVEMERVVARPDPTDQRRADTAPAVIRLTLALIAAAQILIAVPALIGNDLGATIHVAHEQGAWSLALAAALAAAAWRPSRAAGLLPLLAVFVGCMSLLTVSDIIAGRVAPTAELPHLMAAVGLLLLWLESHPPAGLTVTFRPAPAPPRQRVAA
jgi:predicted anti-sigma-YlaC factor YlaD